MASISDSTQHSTSSIIPPANKNIDTSAPEVWTGQLHTWIISLSRYSGKALLWIGFWLGDDDWIENHLPIIGTLYFRDIFKFIQFPLGCPLFKAAFHVALFHLADSECRPIWSEMKMGDLWCHTQYQLSAGATIVSVICASNKTHLTNVSGD